MLKWDALKEKKGNHGMFDAFWTGPFIISQIQGNNTFMTKVWGEKQFLMAKLMGVFSKFM